MIEDPLDLVLVVVRLACGLWLFWSLPVLVARSRGGPLDLTGRVDVVVPARDEADQLPGLLATLADSGASVVVVDDESTDATQAVALASGARVIEGRPLPEGWQGKSWACHQGAAATSGEILVFVDADVRLGPGSLDAVAAEVDRVGGLVSVQPFHVPGAAVEHLAAICNVVAVAATDMASPTGTRSGPRGAFGPVLAMRRADHDAVGGHASIASSIVDDVALAAAFGARRLPVTVLGGGAAISFRMYPRGLRQLVEGFTKNLATGAASVRVSTMALTVAWLTLLVQATVSPIRALAGEGSLATAAAIYLVVAAQVGWMTRRIGRFGWLTPLLFPLSLVVFFAVFAASVVGAVRGQVSWRGRRVRLRSRHR